jgi:hypothetical protein
MAEASAAVKRLGPSEHFRLQSASRLLDSTHPSIAKRALADVRTLLTEFALDYDSALSEDSNVIVEAGRPFDYFEALTDIASSAANDLYFVDPYADVKFLSRYIKPIQPHVSVRILADRYSADLKTASELLAKQTGQSIEVRAHGSLHDRFIFVDASRCFTSGASFKDGGARTATHISELQDVASLLLQQYETIWQSSN